MAQLSLVAVAAGSGSGTQTRAAGTSHGRCVLPVLQSVLHCFLCLLSGHWSLFGSVLCCCEGHVAWDNCLQRLVRGYWLLVRCPTTCELSPHGGIIDAVSSTCAVGFDICLQCALLYPRTLVLYCCSTHSAQATCTAAVCSCGTMSSATSLAWRAPRLRLHCLTSLYLMPYPLSCHEALQRACGTPWC